MNVVVTFFLSTAVGMLGVMALGLYANNYDLAAESTLFIVFSLVAAVAAAIIGRVA